MKFSFSKLQIPCPRALSLALEGREKEVMKAPETMEGISIHDLLDDYLKHGDYFPPNLPLVVKDFLDVVRRKGAQTEVEFTYSLGDDEIEGRIDLVYRDGDILRIIDFKTSPVAIVRPIYRLQADIYALNYLLKGETHVQYDLFFVRVGQLVTVRSYSVADEFAIKRRLRYAIRKAKRMLENPDRTVVTHYCFFCPYVRSCPAVSKDMLSIEGIAEEYVKALAKVKKLGDMLRGVLKETKGTIKVGDSIVGYHPKVKTKVDKEMFFAFVDAISDDDLKRELIRPDLKALRKLAKHDDRVSAMITTEVKMEFDVRREEDAQAEDEEALD